MSADVSMLLAHNAWANRRVARLAARSVPDPDASRPFPMGVGSLPKTLAHIAGASALWSDLLSGRAPRPALEDQPLTLAQTPGLLARADAELTDAARDLIGNGRLDEVMQYPNVPQPFQRRAGIHHVINHNAHHRAQAMNMLRHLAPSIELPDIDVLEFIILGDTEE